MKGTIIKIGLLCECLMCASACASQSDSSSARSSELAGSSSEVSELSAQSEDSAESSEESESPSEDESSGEESSEQESSEEESSEAKEPAFSKDEMIDLLLKNEDIWAKDTVAHANEDDVKTEISFFDMDWDGSEEFIASISRKNGTMTDSYIYTVRNGELVFLNKVIGDFKLYKYYNEYPVMVSFETTGDKAGKYTESCYRYIFLEEKLVGTIKTYAVHNHRAEDGEEYVSYYVPEDSVNVRPDEVDPSIIEEVNEAGFTNGIEDATYDCEEIKSEADKYSGADWLSLNDEQKKQTLSDLYDSYSLK